MDTDASKAAPPGRTIVIVDDEPLLREYEIGLLEELGFPIVDFARADEALGFLKDHAREVFVLFTDVRMPGAVDGLDLARWVARECPWIRIVVVSAHLTKDDERLPGDAAFFRKPFLPLEVIRIVNRWSGPDQQPQ